MRCRAPIAHCAHCALNTPVQIKVMDLETHDHHCKLKLIHSADPQSRSIGTIVFAHAVRTSHFSKSSKTKQSNNNISYWRDCESGRVDH